jgi:putative heme utilization carrier protein HutX
MATVDTMTDANGSSGREPLATRLARNADGILEQVAREYQVSTFEVVRNLVAEQRTIVEGERLASVFEDLVTWGEVLFLMHTPDIVLECTGAIPAGSFGHGYFNLHGDSPIGGHIRAGNCSHIAFVVRPFMGRESRSIQFFNGAGEAMFKIYVRRDAARELLPEQVARFDALRARCSETAEAST